MPDRETNGAGILARTGLAELTETAERLQRMWMLELGTLLARTDDIEDAIEGGQYIRLSDLRSDGGCVGYNRST